MSAQIEKGIREFTFLNVVLFLIIKHIKIHFISRIFQILFQSVHVKCPDQDSQMFRLYHIVQQKEF